MANNTPDSGRESLFHEVRLMSGVVASFCAVDARNEV